MIKTAISIDESLFAEVSRLSDETKLSRSQIFSQAVRYFIERNNNLELVRKINEAYPDVLDENEAEMELIKKSKRKYKEVLEERWQ